MITTKAFRQLLPAALVILSVAFSICVSSNALAQDSKINRRTPPTAESHTPESSSVKADEATFAYEFSQPDFYLKHIVIQHDSSGRGKIEFERLNEGVVSEPLQISPVALARIIGYYTALGFLESNTNYQSERQFPHLGTVRLTMQREPRKRTVEFNWTNDKSVAELREEYRRLSDQAVFVFDMEVARQNQPLNSPKLLEGLETLLRRRGLSDPKQLVPLLNEITTDEHLPLIARNHASRLLKKINETK